MSFRRVAAVLACVVAVSLLGVYFSADDAKSARPTELDVQPASRETQDPAGSRASLEHADAAERDLEASAPEAADERHVVVAPLLSGSIADPSATAVASAMVSWTTCVTTGVEHAIDVDASERTTVWTTSDSAGEFHFDDAPAGSAEFDSVIWITHPAHEAIAVPLTRDRQTWSAFESVSMTPARAVECFVVNASNRAVASATIEQRAHVADDRAATKPDVALRRLLHRSVETGPDGRAKLAPFPGEQWVQARTATSLSEPTITRNGAALTFVLGSTFTVEGAIHGLADLGEIEGRPNVVCQTQHGNVVRTLAFVPVEDETYWGPATLPLLAGRKYRFFLQGGKLVPNAQIVEAPSNGKLIVNLPAEVGHDVWFHVADESASPLPESLAVVTWTRDGHEFEASARPREDGFTLVRGCPSGTIVCEARCPGFRSQRHVPETLPEATPVSRGFRLLPAGRIRGRCFHAGQPVRNFDVTVWPKGESGNYRRHSFTDREDGSFEIDDAPRGDVLIMGSSPTLPPSSAHSLTVRVDAPSELVIELPEPIRGRGKVVDGSNEKPLADARVQPYATHEHDEIASLCPPYTVDDEGGFELDALAPGRNVCAISAPGFATSWAEVQGVSGQAAEFGVIALSRRQPLRVRLLSDGTQDLADFWIRLVGPDLLPLTQFPVSGELSFDTVSPGRYDVNLSRAVRSKDSTFVLRHHVTFDIGRDWQVDLRISGGCKVVVAVEPEGGQPLPSDLLVMTTCSEPGGEGFMRYWPVPENGIVSCDGILPGHLAIDVSRKAELLAREDLSIALDERERHVRIPLAKRHNVFPVRVVDAAGMPLPEVRVALELFRDGTKFQENTDAKGECTFRAIDPGRYRAHLFHQALGWVVALAVELKSGEMTTLTFDASARVQVLLLDGQDPRKGVRCMLWDEDKAFGFFTMSSDESGLARADKLSAGAYLLEIREPGYWPGVTRVVCREDAQPVPLQVRRMGEVELDVRTTAGVSVTGIAIRLFHVDFAQEVTTWIEDGRVSVSERGLATDREGKLHVSGLPSGTYRWSLAAGGEGHEGSVVVPPGDVGRVAIVVR